MNDNRHQLFDEIQKTPKATIKLHPGRCLYLSYAGRSNLSIICIVSYIL